MKNPWSNLPESKPYVLGSDLEHIEYFNGKASSIYSIHTDILPEPFLGNPELSTVLFLNLNPGYDEIDQIWHNNDQFKTENINNLSHKSRVPFYLLDPEFKQSGGYYWWSKHLRELIEEVGIQKVAEKIMCIEYFPYHSISYKELKSKKLINNVLDSQLYGAYLIREAIRNNKLIVIMRGKKLWLRFVPELENYNYISLNSSQSVYISRKNIKNNRFDELIEAIA